MVNAVCRLSTDETDEELAPVVEAPAAAQPLAQAPAAEAPAAAPAPAEPTATPAPPRRRHRQQTPAPALAATAASSSCAAGPHLPQRRRRTQVPVALHPQRHRRRPAAGQLFRVGGKRWPEAARQRQRAQHCPDGPAGATRQVQLRIQSRPRQIPGNNVAGNYAIWVLDGNGERDSQTFSFTVPDGQGEVWMEFDQG